MCGICGIFFSDRGGHVSADVLSAMNRRIAHRGPDDEGFFVEGNVGLAMRRLSIIDVKSGHQPLANENEDIWIVYNGEIYNHAELKADLEAKGHRYRTRSDTETIVHLYEQYGRDCVSHLRGMFAFVIWDRRKRVLFAARDRLGIKPFYYRWDGKSFLFGSEIKAILAYPNVAAELNRSKLAEYLAFGYLTGPETMFEGIKKLMPGHTLMLEVADDGPAPPNILRYWDVPPPEPGQRRDEREWIEECRQRLEETVRMRLMSDVPLGMFLSGGVDSSAIAALIRQTAPGPVETFSVGYREAPFSELGYARQVAQTIGTVHHEVIVTRDDFFAALPRLIWHEDEPLAWPSSVSLYFVSKLASERVKVVLTGEGADELFAGYARYGFYLRNQRWAGRYRHVPPGLRQRIRNWLAATRLLSADQRRKLQHTLLGRGDSLESLYLDNFYSAFPPSEQEQWLRRGPAASPYANFLRYWDSDRPGSLLAHMLYADQKTYLVELLMKQDQMSMATSIESRVPFLDHLFVEFAARVPDALKIRGRTDKYILKRAVKGLLPRKIVYRKKMGFPTPLRQWLREPGAASLLDGLRDKQGLLAEYIDPAAVALLLERHAAGLEDATDRIWRLLNLQLWGGIFISRRPLPDLAAVR
ncbi:MAG: asparagine synthase (glutamine-hydrolyzing) [Bryobacteraceae bacterium]